MRIRNPLLFSALFFALAAVAYPQSASSGPSGGAPPQAEGNGSGDPAAAVAAETSPVPNDSPAPAQAPPQTDRGPDQAVFPVRREASSAGSEEEGHTGTVKTILIVGVVVLAVVGIAFLIGSGSSSSSGGGY